MVLSTLTAISPVDGRYRNKTENLANYFSEFALIRYRVRVEIEYFIALSEYLPQLGELNTTAMKEALRAIYQNFTEADATSQDINNTSVPLSLKEALEEVYYPGLESVVATLRGYAEEWMSIPMLAKTHGQPASPTRLGKEIMVFVYRLEQQLALLKAVPISAKFGGATGNFNAHHVDNTDL